MIEQDKRQIVVDITYDFIRQAASQELPLFRGISDAYLDNPEKVLRQQYSTDDVLGFGINPSEISTFLTPIVLPIVTEAITSLTQKAVEPLGRKSWNFLRNAFKSKSTKENAVMQPLTPEQITLVREQVYTKARKSNFSDAKATMLADSVIGGITIASAKEKL